MIIKIGDKVKLIKSIDSISPSAQGRPNPIKGKTYIVAYVGCFWGKVYIGLEGFPEDSCFVGSNFIKIQDDDFAERLLSVLITTIKKEELLTKRLNYN